MVGAFDFCSRQPSITTLDLFRRYISAALVSKDGERLALYRKTHLWDPFSRFERNVFVDGPSLSPVVDFMGVRIGLMVCWDAEFPEPSRTLALCGAQLIITIAANADTFVLSHVVRVRAFENLLHFIYCNSPGVPFCGSSIACDPTGGVQLALPIGEALGVVEVNVGSDSWKGVCQRNPFFHHRRADLYGPVVEKKI